MLQKVLCFEVVVAAEAVRLPFSLFSGVVQIEHRSDRVATYPVDMIFVEPEIDRRNQKAFDLVFAVVENFGAPFLMLAFFRICVFVARSAVEHGEAVLVLREMRQHEIQNDAYPRLVAFVNEIHEILRTAVAAGRGEHARNLIAPAAVERIFRYRHKLDVRVVQFFDVWNQLIRQLFVVENVAVGVPSPAARMHLVDVHRAFVRIDGFPLFQPLGVLPLVAVEFIEFAAVCRSRFEMQAVRIGLKNGFAVFGHGVLVNVVLRKTFYRGFPYSALLFFKRRGLDIPVVEIADEADAVRIRSPNPETPFSDALFAVFGR